MTLFETLKFLHIVAAAVVLGGGVMFLAVSLSALLGKNGDRLRATSNLAAWVGTRIFAPAWALVLAFGVWTALEGSFDFGDAWIAIGFVVFAIAFILGPTAHMRNSVALGQAIEADGPASPGAFAVMKRETLVQTLEVALTIFAAWVMTAKPGM